jgi:hypothetical protein
MGTAKKKPSKKKQGDDALAVDEEPIIITGGSVILEYADNSNNKFDEDGSTPGKRKKLRNKSKGSDKVQLTHVDVTDKDDIVLMRIDLDMLGINKKCKVKVYYTT